MKWIEQFREKRYLKNFPDLQETQWWSYDELVALQNQRLRHIVAYAYRNIPAYKKRWDQAGVHPRDIDTIEDLPKLPIVTRKEIQENIKDFYLPDRVESTLQTGGSTGETLNYHYDRGGNIMRKRVHERGWSWMGMDMAKDKIAVVMSSQGVLRKNNVLNLFGDSTVESLEKNVALLKEFEPQFLRGYVNSLYILGLYCLENNIKIPSVKGINTISENLYDYQRELLTEVFEAEVFEEYVCNDGGAGAWECKQHAGLHYAMERSVIESIDGRVVVTDLWNEAMPFIRYENGDLVTFLDELCTCGRKLPLIRVKGRTNDILITPDGRRISPTYLMYYGAGYYRDAGVRSNLRQIQYIQKPGYKLEINIVPLGEPSALDLREFTAEIQRVVGEMDIEIHLVETLPATKSGKRQFIINEDMQLLEKMRTVQSNA